MIFDAKQYWEITDKTEPTLLTIVKHKRVRNVGLHS